MMVRAATTRAIDFTKADPYNPQWMHHLRLVLAEMTRQASLEFTQTLHQHYTSFATIPQLEEASFKQLRDGANNVLDIIIAQSEPWNKDKEKVSQTQKDQVKAAVQEWEDHYGKLDDPKVQEAINASVIAIKQHRVQEEIKRKAQEAIWKGQHKGTRKERHRAKRTTG